MLGYVLSAVSACAAAPLCAGGRRAAVALRDHTAELRLIYLVPLSVLVLRRDAIRAHR